MKELEIKEKQALVGIKLVSEPNLITVRVLKKKFLDQMEGVAKHLKLDEIEIIGIADHEIVFRDKNSKLKKVHRSFFIDALMAKFGSVPYSMTYDDLMKKIDDVLVSLPQLFTE